MMNRKEFKNLLTEWNKNFISERTSPELEKTLQSLLGQKGLDKNLSKFDIVHVDTVISNEMDDVRLEEIQEFPGAIQVGYTEDSVAFVNSNKSRKDILDYLLDKKAITQSEVNRVNLEGKSRDIMIIFNSGDLDDFSRSLDTTYNDAIFNLHDTFHMIFDFNLPNRQQGHLNTMDFDEILMGLSSEDRMSLVEYVNKKLSAIDTSKYQPHKIEFEDFYTSFIAFIYLFVLSPDLSIKESVNNIFEHDNFEKRFSNPSTIKDIVIKCANGLKDYAEQSANDPVKYIYINLA